MTNSSLIKITSVYLISEEAITFVSLQIILMTIILDMFVLAVFLKSYKILFSRDTCSLRRFDRRHHILVNGNVCSTADCSMWRSYWLRTWFRLVLNTETRLGKLLRGTLLNIDRRKTKIYTIQTILYTFNFIKILFDSLQYKEQTYCNPCFDNFSL